MRELVTFAVENPTEDGNGGITARIVPFGVTRQWAGQDIRFERGALTVPGDVPLTLDHSDDVLSTIGAMTGYAETEDGAYATFTFADTQPARDTRSLLADGHIRDVSIGVADFSIDHGVMSGTLDHTTIAQRGRFGNADNPSKVLSVHNQKEAPLMEATDQTATPEVVETTEAATFDAAPLLAEIAAMRDELDAKLTEKKAPTAADAIAVFDKAIEGALRTRADFAIADVVGDLGTGDASGLSPDWYWAAGLQQRIDQRRPIFTAAGTGPFPSYGNALASARVTQNVAVGSGKAQKGETASQALVAIATSFPVVFHSGAVDVALELISQSSPEVTRVLRNSFLTAYAAASNADAAAKAQAAGTHTGAALPTDTYANFAAAVIDTSNLIEDGTGRPGDRLAVTPAQWSAILSLMDGGDRRQFAVNGPQNSDGQGELTVRAIDVGGVAVFRDPDVAVAIQFNTDSLVTHEKAPEMVTATNVPQMGVDMGIIGATVVSTWPVGLYSYEL